MLRDIKFKNINLGAVSIRYVEYGNGPLVIMVHGWPESWYSWRHQIKPIANLGYKVIAIDVRGYGGSSKPFEVEKYDMMIKELYKTLVPIQLNSAFIPNSHSHMEKWLDKTN